MGDDMYDTIDTLYNACITYAQDIIKIEIIIFININKEMKP